MHPPAFVLLSFEGPDPYSRAGGLASRISEMAETLARLGFETHLFFIGDPDLPGHEITFEGRLHLHRWCQWISRYHPGGVYDGEEEKLSDWNRSLPGWLESEIIGPAVAAGRRVVVLAEEWQTCGSVIALERILRERNRRDRVLLLWNANNTFSFHRVEWEALRRAAALTTVSRFMKHLMWRRGVDPRILPNGISRRWLSRPGFGRASVGFQDHGGRPTLLKMARWDPDKRWDMAVRAVGELKRRRLAPLFLARGGVETHGEEVLERAAREGLTLARVRTFDPGISALLRALKDAEGSDMVVFETPLSEPQRRFLYRNADAVLANSGLEPFGLVGLEAMACGGLAMVGCTGEDYVTPGFDAIALQSSDPAEIVHHVLRLHRLPAEGLRLRRAARETAQRFTWEAVFDRCLFPFLEERGFDVNPGPSGPRTRDREGRRRRHPAVRNRGSETGEGLGVPV